MLKDSYFLNPILYVIWVKGIGLIELRRAATFFVTFLIISGMGRNYNTGRQVEINQKLGFWNF